MIGRARLAIAPPYPLRVLGVGLAASTATGGTTPHIDSLVEDPVLALFFSAPLLLVSFALYVAGFAKLRRADPKFTAQIVLSVIDFVGSLLLVTVVGLLAGLGLQVVNCGGPRVATSSCVNLSTVTVDPTYLLVGLVVAIIGWAGLILGLYRLGDRYSSTITRIGGILYAVPDEDVVALSSSSSGGAVSCGG